MATTSVTLNTTWQQIGIGPVTGLNVSTSQHDKCRLWVGSTAPAVTEEGIIVNPVDFRNFDLVDASEILYARADRANVEIKVTT